MKALRIVQVIALVLAAVYVLLFHNANPATVAMPFLPSMPPALLVVIVALVAWFVGWLPGRTRAWSLERRLRAAQADRETLGVELERARRSEPSDPVIPDRPNGAVARGDDPTDYL